MWLDTASTAWRSRPCCVHEALARAAIVGMLHLLGARVAVEPVPARADGGKFLKNEVRRSSSPGLRRARGRSIHTIWTT